MDLFIVLFIVLFFILAVRELEWAVMLLLAGLPLYLFRFKIFGLPSTVLEVMILISFAVWFFKHIEFINFLKRNYRIKDYFKNRKKRIKYPFGCEIIALLFISFISIALAGFSNASLGIWKAYFFEPILVFILVLNVFKPLAGAQNKEFLKKVLWPLFFSALAVSFIAILQCFGIFYSPENFWPRVTGPWSYPNALGLFIGPLIPLMLAYSFFLISNIKRSISNKDIVIKNEIIKIIFLVFIAVVSFISLFLARSEGAVIGVITAAALFFLFAIFRKKKIFVKIMGGGAAIIFIFVIFSTGFFLKIVPEYKYYNSSYSAVNYLTDKLLLKDFSGEVRKQQWRETFQMMSQDWRWLTGTGLSRYQVSVKPFHQEGIFFNKERDPDFRRKIVWFDEKYKSEHWQPVEIYMYSHNIILNFWTELGLAGALLFIWIIGKYFYIGFKNIRNSASFKDNLIVVGLIGAMLVIIIHGIVDVPYFKNDLSVMFWVLIAVMSMINLQINSSRPTGKTNQTVNKENKNI